MTLISIECPQCKKSIFPKDGDIKVTNSYSDCLRICDNCEIGFSNSKLNPTTIFKNYVKNIPVQLVDNLDNSLSSSINIFNRKNKKNKFGFSTSEDALTWSFFKYFVANERYQDLLDLLNIQIIESNYDIYLWGTKINLPTNKSSLIDEFIKISNSFNESSRQMTEPDVILELSDKLIFIEVKYLSCNEIKTDKNIFTKYFIDEVDAIKVSESGHYELFRNWAFASKLSNGKEFQLINLGFNRLFKDKNKDLLIKFENSLKSINGTFTKLGWEEILEKVNSNDYDLWFKEYLNEKMSASR